MYQTYAVSSSFPRILQGLLLANDNIGLCHSVMSMRDCALREASTRPPDHGTACGRLPVPAIGRLQVPLPVSLLLAAVAGPVPSDSSLSIAGSHSTRSLAHISGPLRLTARLSTSTKPGPRQ